MSRVEINIEAKDVFEKTTEHLRVLMRCRDVLTKFLKLGLQERLIEQEQASEWEYQRGRFKKELAEYETKRVNRVTSGSPVELWLQDVEFLRAEQKLVKHIWSHFGPYDQTLPRELGRELEHLMKFDDSE